MTELSTTEKPLADRVRDLEKVNSQLIWIGSLIIAVTLILFGVTNYLSVPAKIQEAINAGALGKLEQQAEATVERAKASANKAAEYESEIARTKQTLGELGFRIAGAGQTNIPIHGFVGLSDEVKWKLVPGKHFVLASAQCAGGTTPHFPAYPQLSNEGFKIAVLPASTDLHFSLSNVRVDWVIIEKVN